MIIIFIILLMLILVINSCNQLEKQKIKEGFIWSDKITCEYKNYIKTFSPTYRFNMDVMKQNATEEEIKYLLKYNKYPWSEETKKLYLKSIEDNNMIRQEPEASLNRDISIFPEYAIQQKLLWKSKEGQFLLYGAKYPDKKDQIPYTNNNIQCKLDSKDNKFYMNKKIYKDINNMYNVYDCEDGKIKNKDIPNVLPGFQFINNSCNPCGPLNDIPEYDCPFMIKIKKDDDNISSIWRKFWNI